MEILILSYVSRSGSTFLSNFISKNDDICVLPEANILTKRLLQKPHETFNQSTILRKDFLHDQKLKNWNIDYEGILKNSTNSNNFEIFYHILNAYRQKYKPVAQKILFKESKNILPAIDYMLSRKQIEFKFITITRDGRAVYASQKASVNSVVQMPMEVSPIASAKRWSNFMKMVGRYSKLENTLVLTYEDLIINYEETTKNLSNFLGYNINSFFTTSADLDKRIPESQRHLHKRINDPPDKARINSWEQELSNMEIFLYEKYASNELSPTYNIRNPSVSLLKYPLFIVYYKIKELIRIILFGIVKRLKRLT